MSAWEDDTHVGDDQPPRGPSAERAYLIVLSGLNVGEMYRVGDSDLVVGRAQGCGIQVIDDGASRHHATVRLIDGEVWVEDTASRNGTFVNGERIEKRRLSDGDKVQIGGATVLKFTYSDDFDENFQRRMYESALRDPLTKAFNKRYFLDRLESEFRFAMRHRVALSLVLIDLDHFKQINDRHGHIAGDTVLAAFARRIHDVIRNEDVFARYGGEEFVVLCRQIDVDQAAAFAERLRRTIESLEIPSPSGRPLRITASFGVAGLPDLDAADSLGLLAAADQALYVAKNGGRNRVAQSPPALVRDSDER
jgi:two-component system cell cycle response regulator